MPLNLDLPNPFELDSEMTRRASYTQVEKKNFQRAPHIEGKGDVLYRGFACLNPKCSKFIFVEDREISDDFNIICPECKFEHTAGEATIVYDYDLRDKRDNSIFESGKFEILHDDYLEEAKGYKYCIICSAMKPLELFDRHGSRETQRQGECNLCKRLYNAIKNQTRLADQHREASQKRRLYTELTNSSHIDIGKIYEKFSNKCFKCNKELSADREKGKKELKGNLDHTLPAKWLWPLTTDNATLLCSGHNAAKAEKWPGDFYTDAELRKLAPLVGIDYLVLKGAQHFNPEALKRLEDAIFVEKLFARYARYLDELISLRNRILDATEFDFFKSWSKISQDWIKKADAARAK
jgi:hypothetical protein